MNLESARLLLYELSENDLQAIHELNSFPEVDEFNTLGIPENKKVTQQYLDKLIKAQHVIPRASYNWKISSKNNHQFLGMAGLNVSNDRFLLGEIYYNLHPDYWGKGFATETAQTIIKFGFETLKLHKIEAGVQTENLKSIHVLEKLGMTREGLRRKILPIRGIWKDNYHYAILEDDLRNY